MKTAIATNSNTTVIINIDDEIEDCPGLIANPYNLTKAQAVRLLDRKFIEYVTANGAPHLISKAPDFRTLVDENIRTQDTTDSNGNYKRRGNRFKWGQIPHLRQSRGKNFALFFRESDLINWFNIACAPIISKTLH